jgi:hypothetical protein
VRVWWAYVREHKNGWKIYRRLKGGQKESDVENQMDRKG